VLLFGASLLGQVLNPIAALSPVIFAVGAFGMSQTMPNISALISRSTAPDRQGAMLGLNMASSSAARILGPIVAGALFSGVGPSIPMLVGSIFCLFAGWAAINAGRVYRQTHPSKTRSRALADKRARLPTGRVSPIHPAFPEPPGQKACLGGS
jgi:DHA1 family tetracycline resistance protein-like MFS transporter